MRHQDNIVFISLLYSYLYYFPIEIDYIMDKRYIELKVTLTSLGVNITELDRIKS